jgi:hypothetical protein
MKRLLVAAGLALQALAWVPVARADETRAAEAFQRGAEAYRKNDFPTAARLFERAFAEAPRAAAMYNAGLAWESAAEPARAADAYAVAVARGELSPAQNADTQSRLKALMRSLGRVEIVGPPGTSVSVAHVENKTLPAVVHLSAGTHPLRVMHADGTTVVKSVTLVAGATAMLAIERPPPKVEPPVPSKPLPPASTGTKTPPPVLDRETKPTPILTYAGFSAIGVGAVLGGAALVTGVNALSARDEFNDSGFTNRDAHDRADSLRTTTNVLLVAAGVVGAAGVVLVLTAPSASGSHASVGLGARDVTLRVRF